MIVPFGADEIAGAFHGAVLVPWPNRLRDGQYSFDGTDYQVPLTRACTADRPARAGRLGALVRGRAGARIGSPCSWTWCPRPATPSRCAPTITYELTDEGLVVTLTTRNLGLRDAPYGVGFHPWLSPG